MSDKIKSIVMTIVFVVIIISMLVINVFSKDIEISQTERRPLAKFPELTLSNILDASAMDKFEDYTTAKLLLAFERYNCLHNDGVVDATIEVWHNESSNSVYAEIIW